MGTRGMNVIVVDGEIKVAQYNQWDSYPSGQGADVLTFLREKMDNSFKDKVRGCSWITPEEHQQLWINCGADPNSEFVNMDVSDKFKQTNFHLHRDCGSDIYTLIQDSENGLKVKNSINFAADSLFCEWAYVVDLDKKTFEVYKGFNNTKLEDEERFAFLNAIAVGEDKKHRSEPYYPVKLVKAYSFDNLPDHDQFLEDVNPKEDEEE